MESINVDACTKIILKVKATPCVLFQVWDLAAALDPRAPSGTLCVRTLVEHSGRVFRLQFDEFQIVSRCVERTIFYAIKT